MSRHYKDWLKTYTDLASAGEAPARMNWWAGVSVIASVLQRKVYIDQLLFKWYPNMYIIFVAPPGVVTKSTAVNNAFKLAKALPSVKFGPDIVTGPALLDAFQEAQQAPLTDMEIGETTACLTLLASELGNLLDVRDRAMINLFIDVWDCRDGAIKKKTRHVGNSEAVNPWLNILACTTPSWLAENFPESFIEGGFTSRCLFVYSDTKARYIAYPSRHIQAAEYKDIEAKLTEDLQQIALLEGEYKLTDSALQFGEAWYEAHNKALKDNPLNNKWFAGYLARKQAHIHKLALVIAAATSESLVISKPVLAMATQMVSDLEPTLPKVFINCGRSDKAMALERLIDYVRQYGRCEYSQAIADNKSYFGDIKTFENALALCLRAGSIKLIRGDTVYLEAA